MCSASQWQVHKAAQLVEVEPQLWLEYSLRHGTGRIMAGDSTHLRVGLLWRQRQPLAQTVTLLAHLGHHSLIYLLCKQAATSVAESAGAAVSSHG